MLCHWAAAKSVDLRKNEPHPMAALAPGTQLFTHGVVDRLLGIEEALQVAGTMHGSARQFSLTQHAQQRVLAMQLELALELFERHMLGAGWPAGDALAG